MSVFSFKFYLDLWGVIIVMLYLIKNYIRKILIFILMTEHRINSRIKISIMANEVNSAGMPIKQRWIIKMAKNGCIPVYCPALYVGSSLFSNKSFSCVLALECDSTRCTWPITLPSVSHSYGIVTPLPESYTFSLPLSPSFIRDSCVSNSLSIKMNLYFFEVGNMYCTFNILACNTDSGEKP